MTKLRGSRRTVILSSDDEDARVQASNNEANPSGDAKSRAGRLRSSRRAVPTSEPIRTVPASALKGSPKKPDIESRNARLAPPKTSGKPIYSFFNAATQNRQPIEPLPDREKLTASQDALDTINDNSEDEILQESATISLASVSSTTMALRKRTLPQSSIGIESAALPPSGSQKFRKVGNGDRIPSVSVPQNDDRPWVEKFAPKDLSELAVHKRKVADVRQWIETSFRGNRRRVLVLKGVAGTGKTTTLRLLANDMGYSILEWRDHSVVADIATGTDEREPSSSRFEEFVTRAGRSAGLLLSSDSSVMTVPHVRAEAEQTPSKSKNHAQILLVEEFPNTFSRTSTALQSFRSTVLQYITTPVDPSSIPTPIIMVISETLLSTNTAAADSFTAHRLLGPELISNPLVNMIEFNPVAPTILVKALENVVIKEARISGRRKTPGAQVLKHLAETGDIRSAISSLEFMCLRGDESDTWSSKVAFTKPKQAKTLHPLTKAEEEALRLVTNRESSLGIFHAVGKVVYNKRMEPTTDRPVTQPLPWLPQHRRSQIPETDANHLIDELGTDSATFIAALHENYVLSCGRASTEDTLDSLQGCMDNLSDSDLLSLDRFSFGTRAFSGSATDTLRQDEMCFQIAVRGLLFSLPSPVHRDATSSGKRGDAHRMLYPASLRLWRKQEESNETLESMVAHLSKFGMRDASMAQLGSRDDSLATGVESWKRNSTSDMSIQSTDRNRATDLRASSELKNEMITDRLPYMAQILGSGKYQDTVHVLLERINSIARIDGNTAVDEHDSEDEEENQVANARVDIYATDRPDQENRKHRATTKPIEKTSKESKQSKYASAPSDIPRHIDKGVKVLILEDDDIVDD